MLLSNCSNKGDNANVIGIAGSWRSGWGERKECANATAACCCTDSTAPHALPVEGVHADESRCTGSNEARDNIA